MNPLTLARTCLLLTAWGCSSQRNIDPDIVRPAPGAPFLEKIPGPMLGPFTSYSDALMAACNKILRKPAATTGREDQHDFATRWRYATEYCAWIYYTPDRKYVVSKLTDQSRVDPALRYKACLLPSVVEDPRYPPDSIKYIYALHNHPYPHTLSDKDIEFIAEQGEMHGLTADTKDGPLRLSIIAFFSNKTVEPTCDGFHQYIPISGHIRTWTRTPRQWECRQTGLVRWLNQTEFSVERFDRPCASEDAP